MSIISTLISLQQYAQHAQGVAQHGHGVLEPVVLLVTLLYAHLAQALGTLIVLHAAMPTLLQTVRQDSTVQAELQFFRVLLAAQGTLLLMAYA